MPLSLETLARLATLHEVIEQQAAIALQKRVYEVTAARNAIAMQVDLIRVAGLELRRALRCGDAIETAVATAERSLAAIKREALQKILAEREQQCELARKKYITDRMKLDQIKHLIETARAGLITEQERRQQAMADDRFLALKVKERDKPICFEDRSMNLN